MDLQLYLTIKMNINCIIMCMNLSLNEERRGLEKAAPELSDREC